MLKLKGDVRTKGRVLLNSHVSEIMIENGRAVGVELRRSNKKIRAKRAVISNASIWDTTKLLPKGTLNQNVEDKKMSTPMTG
jgi:phytoene dehydrogenase-like protein